jgi:hypothetical protein
MVAWLFSAGAALGYFSFKDQRAFETSQVTLFDVQQRSKAAEKWFHDGFTQTYTGSTLTVVNLTRPQCRCNRFTAKHLAKIKERFGPANVRFIETEPPAALDWLDATPAALIFDANGSLVYFGPYSSSAWCGTNGGLVEPALMSSLQGKHQAPQPIYAAGCFCGRSHSS